MQQERIGIGSDHAGFRLKESVGAGPSSTHIPSSISDPTKRPAITGFRHRVSGGDGAGEVERGILICGTGVGMSIVANKFAPPCGRLP
jgi:ribose 5-phosphate isomerase B